jgi:RHS repeat-associated protein
VELDEKALLISYEECSPFGSTTYSVADKGTETPNRYRYTGKERDEESGFYYHGARYYAPWLGRWTSCDPSGLVDGPCLYVFAKNEPTNLVDENGRQSGPWALYEEMGRAERAITDFFSPVTDAMKALEPVAEQVIEGDFHKGETTWGGVGSNVVVGLIPVVGQIADARDSFAALGGVWDKPTSGKSWGNLALAAAAWIPGAGDLLKGGVKIERKIVKAGVQASEKAVQETAQATNKVAQGVGDLNKTKKVEKASETTVNKLEKAVLARSELIAKADNALAPLAKQFPNAQIGFRGSLARGTKGAHKGGVPFDPIKFDVDAFIVSDELADAIKANAKGFRNLASDPKYRALVQGVSEKIKKIPGAENEPFSVRVFSKKEFEKTVQANERHFINQ